MAIIVILDNQLYLSPFWYLIFTAIPEVNILIKFFEISRNNYSFINLYGYHYWKKCLFTHDATFKEQLQKKGQKGAKQSPQVLNCVAIPNTACHHIGLIKGTGKQETFQE